MARPSGLLSVWGSAARAVQTKLRVETLRGLLSDAGSAPAASSMPQSSKVGSHRTCLNPESAATHTSSVTSGRGAVAQAGGRGIPSRPTPDSAGAQLPG